MKSYNSIPGPAKAPLGVPCIATVKYDGSNFRAEWLKKRGFYKFGTRTRLLGRLEPIFGEAVDIFMDNYANDLVQILKGKYRNHSKATVFMEFFGPNSFAGLHDPGDKKDLKLFDIHIHRKGILGPREFTKNFGNLPFSAELIYEGNLNKQLIKDVKEGKYNVNEGLVCKGGDGHNLWMAKIKTDDYKRRLIAKLGGKWKNHWE